MHGDDDGRRTSVQTSKDLPKVGRLGDEEAVQKILIRSVDLLQVGALQLLPPAQVHARLVMIQHNLVSVPVAVKASDDARGSLVLYP